ncbi:helix-turn-helix domain-containing protein [Shimia sp. CNT1-13L.2]|uniref:helix-turn-helix domain-containing protein n=1 Tax=Shimia sp. CNT1-13L.2 TaxID=2959663 RepID=UPI0020CB797A|nr:helix-turn-helix domain-containing protein [Shimia sp. CNT1-13L.2]MCP9481673.1 helix-turn-helix domain-containing protein [Shimia sp. CNT1-13L.2]
MGLKIKKPIKSAPKTAPALVQATPPASAADLAKAQPITVLPLVKEPVAAQILGVSAQYLSRDRWYAKKEGIPPKVPFIKVAGGAVRYAVADLQAVIDANRVG